MKIKKKKNCRGMTGNLLKCLVEQYYILEILI